MKKTALSDMDRNDLAHLKDNLNEKVEELIRDTCDSLQYGSGLNLWVHQIIELREAADNLNEALNRILELKH